MIEITNNSDKSIFLPVENPIIQRCTSNSTSIYIEFGIDLKYFCEIVSIELNELSPNASKIFKYKLKDCNYKFSRIHFSYQFYQRPFNKKDNEIIYSMDFADDDDFLITGDWEWGQLIIDLNK